MGYFSNNKTVNFDVLRKSNIYSKILLDEIENGNYKILQELLTDVDRADRDFMEPILYSVKNEYGTYEVYKHYNENLQENIDLAKEIIKEEPELIKDTPVSYNKQFILEAVEINPKVIKHMDQSLKNDSEFVEDLCELKNKEVIMNVAKECKMPDTIIENPTLAENRDFMLEAVKQDAKILEYAPKEFKDDYEFMKEISKNKETINYILENTKDFGEKGLTGAKDALVETSSDEAILGFEEESKKTKEKIQEIKEKGENSDELSELLKRDKQLERHAKFFERIKNGEVDPVRAAKLIDKVCVNLDENYREEIKRILKLDEAILEKQKESKEQEEAEKQEKTKEQEETKIELSDIEKTTEGASLEEIKGETKTIREEIEEERETQENQIGENTDDKSNDERA